MSSSSHKNGRAGSGKIPHEVFERLRVAEVPDDELRRADCGVTVEGDKIFRFAILSAVGRCPNVGDLNHRAEEKVPTGDSPEGVQASTGRHPSDASDETHGGDASQRCVSEPKADVEETDDRNGVAGAVKLSRRHSRSERGRAEHVPRAHQEHHSNFRSVRRKDRGKHEEKTQVRHNPGHVVRDSVLSRLHHSCQ